MNTPSFCVTTAAVVVAAGASFAAIAATLGGTLVMSRSQQAADDGVPRSRNLWLLDVASGQAKPLTQQTDRVFDSAATWAPDGSAFVFDRGTSRVRRDPHHRLLRMTATSARPHTLLHGAGEFTKPAWGSTNKIAYIAHIGNSQCVGVVDPRGHAARMLFCAPIGTDLARPQWSPDGMRLFVAGLRPEGRLEPIFHALAWRIDANTGAAALLSDILMGMPLALSFSPDGVRGVYADMVASDMTLVDFGNGAMTDLPRGHAPLWSPDGRRIAFTGEVYETGAEFRYYEPLYVMNADGTNVRRLTDSRVNNHAYIAAQWSKDNAHVLANRRTFADVSLTHANFVLRIVNADTRALTQLPAGYAEAGSWYQP